MGRGNGGVYLDTGELIYSVTHTEILEEQHVDEFCHTALSSVKGHESLFSEAGDSIICLKHPLDQDLVQVVLPGTLRTRVHRLLTPFRSWATMGRSVTTIVYTTRLALHRRKQTSWKK